MSKQKRRSTIPKIEALPMIPPEITTRRGFTVDTTGSIWRLPPQLSCAPIDWAKLRAKPFILALLQGFIAFRLEKNAESTASTEFRRLSAVNWNLFTVSLEKTKKIGREDVLAALADLKRKVPKSASHYGSALRRLYYWAADMGVPGFSQEVATYLRRMKLVVRPSLTAQSRVAPGVAVSKISKNRKTYDHETATRIEVALLIARRDLRAGTADPRIKLSSIVMTYLAMDHGQRPASFAKIRESHFETLESEGAIYHLLEIPSSKGMNQSAYIGRTTMHSLSSDWGGLIAEMIAQNRIKRETLGLDNTLDWPLFPVEQTVNGVVHRSRASMPHSDPVMALHKASGTLGIDLKHLFEILEVDDGKGGCLVPSFYSFRQTMDTNLALVGTPLMVRAYQLDQTTTKSTPRYDKRGPEFAAALDQPYLRERLEALADPFLRGAKFSDSEENGPKIPFIDPETGIFLGATGRCGCPGSGCGLSGTVECYVCGNFRAMVEGPHARVRDWMADRRAEMKREGKTEIQYSRYDIHILVVEEILRRIGLMTTEKGV